MQHLDAQGAAASLTSVEVSEPVAAASGAVAGTRSLGRQAANGAAWAFLAIAAGRVLGVATNLILARLLSPQDFGLVSFAMILIGAFTILQDLGVPASIVYSKHDIKVIGRTALTINVGAALLLFGVAFVVAPILSRAGGDDDITPLIVILAIGMVVSSLGSVQRALLVKELAFRRKFIPDFVPLIASGIVSIVLALMGFGAWSLVIGYLAKVSMSTGLLWILSAVRPRPGFERSVARDLLHYGKHVSIASIVGFIGLNADYFIIGQQLGTFYLGLYVLAFTISNLPCTLIGQVVSTVMFPAYTRIRDDRESLMQMFENVFAIVSALAVPAAIGIYVAGPTYVPIVFGEKWSGVERPLQILAIYGAIRTMAIGFAPVYNAIGRPSIEWRLNLARILLLIPLMVVLLRYGLIGIPIAYLVLACVFVPLNAVFMSRELQIPGRRFVRLAAPQIAGVGAAALIIGVASLALADRSGTLGPLSALGISVLAIGTYFAVVISINPRVLTLTRDFMVTSQMKHRSAPG